MLQVFGWVTLDESYGFQDKYRGILFPDYVSCRGVGYMTCGRCNGGALPPLSGIGSASWCQSSTPCAPVRICARSRTAFALHMTCLFYANALRCPRELCDSGDGKKSACTNAASRMSVLNAARLTD